MMQKASLLLLLCLLPLAVLCQITITDPSCARDSVCKTDSLRFYRTLHDYALKRRITYLIYGAIFRDPPIAALSVVPAANAVIVPTESYKYYQGKIIRNIRIITVDPMGRVLNDTLIVPGGFIERAGNRLHIKTKNFVVRNKLLFENEDPLDSLKLIESERLLRASTSIRDAKITPLCPGIDSDSLDVLVVVRDLWSINGDAELTTSTNTLRLGDNNFLGLGNSIQNKITYNPMQANSFLTTGNYLVSNIRRSFITVNTYYTWSELNKTIGISVDRGFVSTITKWAGGANNALISTVWPVTEGTTVTNLPLEYRVHDFWLGHSFSLDKGKKYTYKDPRIVLTGRVFNTQYIQRPSFRYDTLKKNQNSTLYMAGVGFCSRSYYKDMNIYRFGRVEDVPEGRLVSFIAGYQKAEYYEQVYYGLRFAAGNHIHHYGYLSEKLEYGTFLNKDVTEKGVLNAELNFLTDLLQYKKWSAREFINIRSVSGFNRASDEHITINDPNGLNGYSSPTLSGTNKTVLNLATIVYMPYKVIGFQFAGILFAGFGKIGNAPGAIANSPVYQAYGIGLLIRNEYLIINTIQISLSYYPIVPGKSPDQFQFNPGSISNVRFTDFSLSKPDFLSYQ
jgi:hypothetical protein